MVIDDDDLIHKDLVDFVTKNGSDTCWFIDKGYFWESGSKRLGKLNNLHKICGTSLIVTKNSYSKYDGSSLGDEYAISEFGSHRLIFERTKEVKEKWRPVPFRATIYRVQHSNSSLTRFTNSDNHKSILAKYLSIIKKIKRGLEGNARYGIGIFYLSKSIKSKFFGSEYK